MTGSSAGKAANSIFVGGGEMGELMRSLDWSQTPLGEVSTWPQSLRSAISILLPSKAQICLFWGSELITLYNDAYRPALASKHPWALGRPARETWSEVWDVLNPLLEGVVTTGEAFWAKDLLFFLNRHGYTEETYFDVSYDPVRDESGEVNGIFCIVSETTGQVLGDRRLQTLSLLASETASAKSVTTACQTAMQALATNPQDIPFALLYQIGTDGRQAQLVATTGIEAETAVAPAMVDLTHDRDQWGVGQIYQKGEVAIVENLATRFATLPSGAWDASPTAAWIVPLNQTGQTQLASLLILGISPHRAFEAEYRKFFELVAGNVATAIASAWAFEEERRRVETLAELDRAKTSFFSNISHEFRTPLTLMLSPLEQTLNELDGIIPEQARSQLELVQRNGKRLLKLVNTLLDFSRIEAGRTQAHFELTDLATYTTELASLFQSAVEQAGLQLIVNCPPLPELVYVDRDMWEKIVLNLLSNAFKFTFEGEIALSLRWETGRTLQTSSAEADDSTSAVQAMESDPGSLSSELDTSTSKLKTSTSELDSSTLELGVSSSELNPSTLELGVSSSELDGSRSRQELTPSPPHPSTSLLPCVVLEVRDTGTGIPAEELPHILKRFHRVEGTRRRTFEGTGIGLSLVQELVHLHSGVITVESTLGQGSTFRVQLPTGTAHLPDHFLNTNCVQSASSNGATSYVQEVLSWLPDQSAGNEKPKQDREEEETPEKFSLPLQTPLCPRILLVDDNADMRDYLYRLLSEHCQVDIATDGEAALAAARASTPDLVLSDVMMPGMDGFALLHQLRSDSQTCDIPILLLSARAGEEAAVEGLNAGADDYLVKPFSARELLARVAANVALGRSRQEAARRRLDAVVSSVADLIYTFDLAGRFTYANQPLLDLWQKSLAEIVGKHFIELDYPLDLATRLHQQVQQVITTGQPLKDETPYTSAFGTRVYEYIFVPLFNAEGAVEAVAGTGRDITDRKQAEAALRQSEERLRLALEAARMVAWQYNPFENTIVATSNFSEIYGLSVYQTADYGFALVHPDDLSRHRSVIEHAVATKGGYYSEFRIIRPDNGAVVWLEERSEAVLDEQGNLQKLVGVAVDITQRKQAEEMVRQSEERYRTLFESIDEGFCILEVLFDENNNAIDYRFLEINPAFEQQTGLEQAVGKTMRQLDPNLEDHWCETYGEIVRTGEPRRFEDHWEAKNRWFDVYACRIGQPAEHKVAVVFKDISEARRIAIEREQIFQREQTARTAAERANQIKDEFLAVLSHELRTPLNPILGWTRLLRNGRLDATRTAQAVEIIERNAKLQVQLIEDLLDISRILRGKLTLNMLPVDLTFAINAALETVRLGVEAKAIRMQIQVEPMLGQVMGDVGRLQQVVWNLLSNAVKFTPTGGQITVTLTQNRQYAQIQVIDTGKGIQPEFLPYVFEHFRQEDSATTRKFGGLGLGLAIARQIVELHGGIIQAESAGEGQGATFTVKLPLRTEVREPITEPTAALSTSALPLLNIRVLVVDDEADTRDLSTFVLEQAGAIVTAASSAIEALEIFAQFQPNILVSDIAMPETDGYGLLRQIRQLPQSNQIPAVALTAYAGEVNQQQAIAAGFQQHLSKPIDSEKLISTICALCDR